MTGEQIHAYKHRYRTSLEQSVIPFWEKHSIDRDLGGYFTCLERDGRVFDTDKFTWLQARQVWMFSKLHTSYRQNSAWLEYARIGADFLKKNGRNPDGDWYFSLDRQGRPLVEAYNIFSDCFAAVAFAEYFRATGDEESRRIALTSYARIQARKDNPKGRFTKQIGVNRPLKAMALPMMQVWMAQEMGDLLDADLRTRIVRENIDQVVRLHIDRRLETVFERVAPDGSHPDCMEGRLLNPGHALEVLWFILRYAEKEGRQDLIELVTQAMLWSAQRGWDERFGGFFYYLDIKGFPPEKLEADMKLWWVHVEALCAFLLAYKTTKKKEFLDWFERTDEYCWKRFDDPRHGEWFGYLHRNGEPAFTLKGGKWKGFFHLPRALLACIAFLDEMEADSEE